MEIGLSQHAVGSGSSGIGLGGIGRSQATAQEQNATGFFPLPALPLPSQRAQHAALAGERGARELWQGE